MQFFTFIIAIVCRLLEMNTYYDLFRSFGSDLYSKLISSFQSLRNQSNILIKHWMGDEFVAAEVWQSKFFEKIYVFILENYIYHFIYSPTYVYPCTESKKYWQKVLERTFNEN